ncbi:hypothetical protein [Gallaecimonas pentaromativorans]|uniref:Uncharacterized protein n=1 Tax=Gallaecimonas pentaromativorans TaxID=584787 RepID=A0A3N1PPT1_9GAMM|nr:hypothetical protein [Gallaecimonas pentaromativorans]ROQ28850.1 hypothetical protein EDC28_103447 [Gallaecimonas pentaromativorans]
MKFDNRYIIEIGSLIIQSDDLTTEDWDSVSIIFDVGEGHVANSGFIYLGNDVEPCIAEIDDEPVAIDNKVIEFREHIESVSGHKFKQLLVQIERGSGKIKIDFEFDNHERWKITPSNINEIKGYLKPNFD